MIACKDVRATESWLSHIHGVTALVELRSSDDWKSTTNLRGFLQVFYIAVCTYPEWLPVEYDSNNSTGDRQSYWEETGSSSYRRIDSIFSSLSIGHRISTGKPTFVYHLWICSTLFFCHEKGGHWSRGNNLYSYQHRQELVVMGIWPSAALEVPHIHMGHNPRPLRRFLPHLSKLMACLHMELLSHLPYSGSQHPLA